jgi:hypothetical protein
VKSLLQTICCIAALLFIAPPVAAQQPSGGEAPSGEAPSGDAPGELMTLEVQVEHGADDTMIADVPVFLRAARPRGPFEPTAPKPEFEWEGFTNAAGVATFDRIPRSLMTSGLKVHAVTTYGGIAFESAAATPAPNTTLNVEVYEKGLDVSVVEIANLRNVVEVWEGYLVFTQYYTLTNTGDTALDVKLLPDTEYEKGIPLVLPVKAKGINITGPGESVVVNSTVFWKGVLKPDARVNLQARFSMTAKETEFVYEQKMDYPTRNVEVVVPIQTQFKKLPRLDSVELRPPGFEETEQGAGIFGLRDDIEFIGARGLSVDAGESFSFQLRGLPFEKPITPWVFLGLGILFGLGIVVIARREMKRSKTEAGRREVREALEAEREMLLDDLVALERDLDEGLITEREYQLEAMALRERLALVLKRLSDLAEDGG